MAGGKGRETVFDCLGAVKSYNFVLQQTCTHALFKLSIYKFKRMKKKVMGQACGGSLY